MLRSDCSTANIARAFAPTQVSIISELCSNVFEILKKPDLTPEQCATAESLLSSQIQMMQQEYEAHPDAIQTVIVNELTSYVKSKLEQKEFKECKPLEKMQAQLETLSSIFTCVDLMAKENGINSALNTSVIPDYFPKPLKAVAEEKDQKEIKTSEDIRSLKTDQESKHKEPEKTLKIVKASEKDFWDVQNKILERLCDMSPATVTANDMKEISQLLDENKNTFINLCRQYPHVASGSLIPFAMAESMVAEKLKQKEFIFDTHLAKIQAILVEIKEQFTQIIAENKTHAAEKKTDSAHASASMKLLANRSFISQPGPDADLQEAMRRSLAEQEDPELAKAIRLSLI